MLARVQFTFLASHARSVTSEQIRRGRPLSTAWAIGCNSGTQGGVNGTAAGRPSNSEDHPSRFGSLFEATTEGGNSDEECVVSSLSHFSLLLRSCPVTEICEESLRFALLLLLLLDDLPRSQARARVLNHFLNVQVRSRDCELFG